MTNTEEDIIWATIKRACRTRTSEDELEFWDEVSNYFGE